MKKTLVVGMSAVFDQGERGLRAKKVNWQMLRLFAAHLADARYAALRATPATTRLFDEPVTDATVHFLNERPFTRWNRLAEMPRVYARLAALARDVDYLYIRLPSWAGPAAYRVARALGKPYWLSIHGGWPDVLTGVRGASAMRRLHDRAMARYVDRQVGRMVAGARHVFFVGPHLARRYGNPSVRQTVFANYLHRAQDVRPMEAMAASGAAARRRVLFVGEWTRNKGVHVLLDAVRALLERGADIEVALVGAGPEADGLERMSREAAWKGRLLLRGWKTPGAELDAEFAAASVLVLPSMSDSEGVPKVIMEAMVRVTPVVASAVASIPDMLGGGERGWLVPAGSATKLADALADVLVGGESVKARVAAARAYALENDRAEMTRRIRAGLCSIDPAVVSGAC